MTKILLPYQKAALHGLGAAFILLEDGIRRRLNTTTEIQSARARMATGEATFDDWELLHGPGVGLPLQVARMAGIWRPDPITTDPARSAINAIVVHVMAGGEITQDMIDAIELCARRIKARTRVNVRNVLFTVNMLQTDLPGVVAHSVNEFAVRYWPKKKTALEYLSEIAIQHALDAIGEQFGDMAGADQGGSYRPQGYHTGGVVGPGSYLVGDAGPEMILPAGHTVH